MSENNSSRMPQAQDQISLVDVLIIILKYKWLIITIVAISIIISILYTYRSNYEKRVVQHEDAIIVDVYYSKCIIEITNALTSKIMALLTSHRITESISKNANLQNIHFGILDEKARQDLQSLEYNQAGGIPDFLRNEKNRYGIRPTMILYIKNNILEMAFFSKDADTPQKILSAYLDQLSDSLREQDIERIELQKIAVQHMLGNARDSMRKKSLSRDMISLDRQELEAKNSKWYGFYVIDPPIGTRKMTLGETSASGQSRYTDRVAHQISAEGQERLRKRKIVIPVIMVSLFLAVVLAFFIEYLKKMKMHHPEKFHALRGYARFKVK